MATTNSGGKFYISPTPQPKDLTQTQFEAITDWIEVTNVGQLPESGPSTNLVNYDTIDTDVTQKSKGVTDAGSGTLECAIVTDDAGQIALRAAALTNFDYATKRELPDAPDANHSNTVFYNRGKITGPTHSGGGVEDFVTETFTFGYNQREIVVAPQLLSGGGNDGAPTNTAVPTVAGNPVVGNALTAQPGTWTGNPTFTYQWKADGAAISGATQASHTLQASDEGKSFTVVVTGTNANGNASAESATVGPVTA